MGLKVVTVVFESIATMHAQGTFLVTDEEADEIEDRNRYEHGPHTAEWMVLEFEHDDATAGESEMTSLEDFTGELPDDVQISPAAQRELAKLAGKGKKA